MKVRTTTDQPTALGPTAPRAGDAALAIDPAERFATAAEFIAAFGAVHA